MKKVLFLLLFNLGYNSAIESQTFLNGDFEINCAVGDQNNLTNSQYDSIMSNSFAFGNWGIGGPLGGNMDVITSNMYCSFAQHGNWYVGLTGGGTDAISLKLSVPLITGQTYTISFYDRYGSPPAIAVSPFQIILSTVDTTFGSVIYTAPDGIACTWSLRTFSFVAPNNGQFITAELVSGGGGDVWCNLDNFNFESTTSIKSISENTSLNIFPNPFTSETTLKTDFNLKDATLTIYNALGQEVNNIKNISGQEIKLSRDNLVSGIYFIRLTLDNKVIATDKLVITD